MNSKIVAFIPARCGSKSIPFKNIKLLNGKPLIYWNISALQKCSQVETIVVSTDCPQIIQVVESFNFPNIEIHYRSEENAQDHSSTESVMLEYINESSIKEDDIIMLVQATSPLTQAHHFQEALELFRKNRYDSLLTCVRVKRFIWSESGQSVNYDYTQRPRRQDFNGFLVENGAFYIAQKKSITRNKNRLSGNIGIYEMPEYTFIEIDEPDDWIVAERLFQKYFKDKD